MSEHATKPAELGTPSMSEIPARKMLPYQPTEEMLQAAGMEVKVIYHNATAHESQKLLSRIYQAMYLAAK